MSRSSVRLFEYISEAPIGRIFMKLDIGNFTKICRETPDLVKIGQKYRALYTKTLNTFLVLTAMRRILQLDSSANGHHFCV
jgi:hypothetical protein